MTRIQWSETKLFQIAKSRDPVKQAGCCDMAGRSVQIPTAVTINEYGTPVYTSSGVRRWATSASVGAMCWPAKLRAGDCATGA